MNESLDDAIRLLAKVKEIVKGLEVENYEEIQRDVNAIINRLILQRSSLYNKTTE